MNWLARLLAWDGVLPLIVWAVPAILNFALPQNDKLAVTVSIVLPIGALLVRFYVGYHMIEANHCSPGFRHVQQACLWIGLFILMCLDSLLITLLSLNLQGPGNAHGDILAVIVIFVILYVPYLGFLTIAMYPGPSAARDSQEPVSRVNE